MISPKNQQTEPKRNRWQVFALLAFLVIIMLLHCACEKEPSETQKESAGTAAESEQLTAGMVLIPAGEFMMGSPPGEGADDEHPQHKVYLKSYYLDKYEVTNAHFCEFLNEKGNQREAGSIWFNINTNAAIKKGDRRYVLESRYADYPVTGVNWYGARAYARWIGKRLPTEAEWEYACRAGTTTKYNVGDSISHDDANYYGTGGKDRWRRTSPVGSFAPNAWGIFDMHGNIREWCTDLYDDDYYAESPSHNPAGPTCGKYHILRGGSWCSLLRWRDLQSATRYFPYPESTFSNVGFRCAKDVDIAESERKMEAAAIDETSAGSCEDMVLITAGEFTMGSPEGEGDTDEHPQHKVYVDAFYIGKYEVTNAQYKRYCDATHWPYPPPPLWEKFKLRPSMSYFFCFPDSPVVNVSWFDATAYAKWAGKRLPTEAEWEFACRAGTITGYSFGNDLTHDDANYGSRGGKDTWDVPSPVGSFLSNPWGLYDMHGNVMEWCTDWYDGNYYSDSPSKNPKGPAEGLYRVARGGHFDNNDVTYLRSAYRSGRLPNEAYSYVGFRCAKDAE